VESWKKVSKMPRFVVDDYRNFMRYEIKICRGFWF